MKLKRIWALALFAVFVLVGCGQKAPVVSSVPSSPAPSSVAVPESVPDTGSSDASEAGGLARQPTKQVGQAGFGFVSVPENWVNFVDADGATAIQYSDPTARYIVSLDNGENAGGATDAEQWATGILGVMDSIDPVDFEGAKVDFHGYEAYQCYGIFSDDTLWVVHIFPVEEDGSLRYLSVEGPVEGFMEVYDLLTESYTAFEG